MIFGRDWVRSQGQLTRDWRRKLGEPSTATQWEVCREERVVDGCEGHSLQGSDYVPTSVAEMTISAALGASQMAFCGSSGLESKDRSVRWWWPDMEEVLLFFLKRNRKSFVMGVGIP